MKQHPPAYGQRAVECLRHDESGDLLSFGGIYELGVCSAIPLLLCRGPKEGWDTLRSREKQKGK